MVPWHSSTRYSDRGVAIDNVLIDHDGKFIRDAGWLWDHAELRNKIVHDYLIANCACASRKHNPVEFRLSKAEKTRRSFVRASGRHYPLEFRRFGKRQQCEATAEEFVDQTKLRCRWVDWVSKRGIPGDLAFDSFFTNAEIVNHIHGKQGRFG